MIVAIALHGFLIGAVCALAYAIVQSPLWDSTPDISWTGTVTYPTKSGLVQAREVINLGASAVVYLASVAGLFGVICAWVYQVGSARLGVVDLFACEISTLARVTIVVDTVRRKVEICDHPPIEVPGSRRTPAPGGTRFNSQENYFPVFEGNTRDLQTLEARVVINITAFYTYMKAVRDMMRAAADLEPAGGDNVSRHHKEWSSDPWRVAIRDLLFMLFLGLESARNAIKDLVEYEPEQTERTIVTLISELRAYEFLLREFSEKKDARFRRLDLRWDDYNHLVPRMSTTVADGSKKAEQRLNDANPAGKPPSEYLNMLRTECGIWKAAKQLLPDLEDRFQEVCNTRSRLAAGGSKSGDCDDNR